MNPGELKPLPLQRQHRVKTKKKKNTTTNSSSSSLYSMLALIIKSKLKIDDGYKKILFILFYNYLIIKEFLININ